MLVNAGADVFVVGYRGESPIKLDAIKKMMVEAGRGEELKEWEEQNESAISDSG
jgi:hypothetical protein